VKKIVTTIFCALMMSTSARSATLDEREVNQVKLEISSMYKAFEHGDANEILDKTHESLYKLAGGKESLEKAMQQAAKRNMALGNKFISFEIGTPTKTYLADEEEVCFVPIVSVVESQGMQVKSTGFMIAIRKRGTNEWRYIDGAGLKNNPDLLYSILFPKLERGIVLPPISAELI